MSSVIFSASVDRNIDNPSKDDQRHQSERKHNALEENSHPTGCLICAASALQEGDIGEALLAAQIWQSP
jgi:hypothetical protein